MATIPLTVKGAEKLKQELHRLKTIDRPAVINAISERARRAICLKMPNTMLPRKSRVLSKGASRKLKAR